MKGPKWTVVLFLLTLAVAFCAGMSFLIVLESNGEGIHVLTLAVEVFNLIVMSWIVLARVLDPAPLKTRETLT